MRCKGAEGITWQLFRLVAEEGTSMADHITMFRKLQDNYAKMGIEIPDGDLALLLITSLPNSWDAFTTLFFRSSYATTTTISLAMLITTLSKEYERRRAKANAMESTQYTVGKSSRCRQEILRICKLMKLRIFDIETNRNQSRIYYNPANIYLCPKTSKSIYPK